MATIVGNKIGKVINLLIDGNIYQKSFEEQSQADKFFKLVLNAKFGGQKELDNLLTNLNRMYRIIVDNILEKDNNDKYYLRGFNYPIPDVLLKTFLEYTEKGYPIESLVNFWKLLMLNPDKKIRETLFNFLNEYMFAITDNGYFTAYKVVQPYQEKINNALLVYVKEKYHKIKGNKKSPKNYTVIINKDNKYLIINGDIDNTIELNDGMKKIGNLAELFESSTKTSSSIIYTDKWNQTTRITLGKKVSKERQYEDHSVTCSENGLHVGSTSYVNSFYSAGNVVLLVLVNPAHVIHIPSETSKLRTAEYFPYGILKIKEKPENDNKFEVLEQPYFETDYSEYEKEQIERDLAIIRDSESNKIPTQSELDYKKILESRLVDLNSML